MYFIKEIFWGLVAIEYCTLDLQWKSDWSRAINQSIYNSYWSWQDKYKICSWYCIYHVEIKVCLVSKPIIHIVFSNFCSLREDLKTTSFVDCFLHVWKNKHLIWKKQPLVWCDEFSSLVSVFFFALAFGFSRQVRPWFL